jgi:hypothetical protein
MRFQIPARPDETSVLLAGLQEAVEAASVPPNATHKERERIFAACKAAARLKWNNTEVAWKIACDEVRVSARAEIEALRAKASAIRAAATTQADQVDAEAAEIEASIA